MQKKTVADFLRQSNFKIKPEDHAFSDSDFMTKEEKENVYRKFIRFANIHFKRSSFNKVLYDHFHLHCGFIAHYNINGFYEEYFSVPHQYHDEKEVFGKEYAAKSFLHIYAKEIDVFVMNRKFGKYGLAHFLAHFFEENKYRLHLFHRGYEDINHAIGEVIDTYVSTWMNEVSMAIEKLSAHEKKLEAEAKKKQMKLFAAQKEEDTPRQLTFEELLAS